MIENAKTGSNLVEHLDLKKETATEESAERAHRDTERKPLLSSSPSSAVVWGVLVGSAIMVGVTFLLLV